MPNDVHSSADLPEDVRLRRVTGSEEHEACVSVQRAAWGETFSDLVPARLLMTAHEDGGVVAGAFVDDARLLGFVFGVPTLAAGTVQHWSHMLAVRPEARGRGLGVGLKLQQREILLAGDVGTVRWTFDPLEARNAHINLNRLGCRVERYEIDMYGPHTGSPLHAGLGTDRFIVAWDLASARAVSAIDRGGAPDLDRFRDAPLVGDPHAGSAPPSAMPGAARVRVAIPARIQAVKRDDPDRGRRWRRRSRRALRWYLERGFEIVGLCPPDGEDRAAYCLESGSV